MTYTVGDKTRTVQLKGPSDVAHWQGLAARRAIHVGRLEADSDTIAAFDKALQSKPVFMQPGMGGADIDGMLKNMQAGSKSLFDKQAPPPRVAQLEYKPGVEWAYNETTGAGSKTVKPEKTTTTSKPIISLEESTTPFESVVALGEPTLAGTPAVTPGLTMVLPPNTDAVPHSTITEQPGTLTGTRAELVKLAQGSDWEALEKKLGNRANNNHLKALVGSGVLRPSDVTSPDVARFIGSTMHDFVPEGKEGEPQFANLFEKGNAFINRSFELRGESPPAAWTPELTGMQLRSSEGDIARVLDNGDGTKTIIDYQGHTAKVQAGAVEVTPQRPDMIPDVDYKNPDMAAESLKKLEQQLGNGQDIMVTTPPKMGLRPQENTLDSFVALTKEAAADPTKVEALQTKLANLQETMTPRGFAAFKQALMKQVTGFEKGSVKRDFLSGRGVVKALTEPRKPVEIKTGPFGLLAKKLGVKLFQHSDGGFIVETADGARTKFKNQADALLY